jgi:SpoVK/Ycf46/Vps4 family AAA+-type ATPase
VTADRSLVEALENVLALQPEAVSVRVHLVQTLLEGDETDRALDHCDLLLQLAPDDREVLSLVADVCDRAGQPGRAAATRRLIAPVDESPASVPSGPQREAEGPDSFGDELDQFVRDVQRQHDREFVRLDDVAGLEDVKARIRSSFLDPLQRPDLRLAYGKTVSGGLLLWGPPGCGKTFMARAVAGELGANFISVGIHDILDMWLGNSEKNMRAAFEAARRAKPCVLFFDELDALGYSRGRQASGGGLRNVVALMLAELDGVDGENDGVFVLAATNQPWDVDPALRRPGRFDRTVLVLPPDRAARRTIVDLNLRNRPVGTVDSDRIAKATDGFSGADIKLVCDAAVEAAMIEAQRKGVLVPIGQAHLEAALAGVRTSVEPWMEMARNHVTYANQSGDYDELAAYLRKRGRR